MTVQYLATLRQNKLLQIAGSLGTQPILRLYNGTEPATCATALSGNTLLAQGTLPNTALVTSGTTAVGSSVLNFTSTTGVAVGQPVSGTGIQAGSVVTSFVANTSVTISLPSTAGVGSGVTVNFGSYLSPPSSGTENINGTWSLTGQAGASASTPTFFRLYESTGTTCYMQGSCGIQPAAISTNGSTAANSNVLNFAATTGVAVGQAITGTGIPPGATVLAFTGTTVTMSVASTAGVGNGVSIQFTYDLWVNGTISNGQSLTVNTFTVNENNP